MESILLFKKNKYSIFLAVIIVASLLTVSVPLLSSVKPVAADFSSDWTAPTNLSLLDKNVDMSFGEPVCTVDSHGYLHVIFAQVSDNAAGTDELYYATNKGGSWTTTNISKLNKTNIHSFWPVLGVDSNDVVHVVYLMNPAPSSMFWQVMYMNNSGGTWSTPLNISQNANLALNFFPSMVFDNNGVLHVVYGSIFIGSSAIMYVNFSASTGWSTPYNLTAAYGLKSIYSFSPIAIDLDPSQHIYIAFSMYDPSGGNSEIYLVNNSIGTWGDLVNVSKNLVDGDYQDMIPTMDIDVHGKLHLAWAMKNNTEYGIKYTSYSGGVWTTPVFINNSVFSVEGLSLTADLGGRPHIVFSQKNASSGAKTEDIFYTSNLNGTFTAPVNLTGSGTTDASVPHIALDSNGYVYIVYLNETGGKDSVFYTRSIQPLAAFVDYIPILIGVGVGVGIAIAAVAAWVLSKRGKAA